MPAIICAAALRGIEAVPVTVEVDVLNGLPSFTVVGLTDKAIQESRERLTAALTNSGFTPPRRKTIVSLAPASLKKEGSMYDLPIALGFLFASSQIKRKEESNQVDLSKTWFIGELGLDGSLRAINGVLPILRAAYEAGIARIFLPTENIDEARCLAGHLDIYALGSLQEVIDYLTQAGSSFKPIQPKAKKSSDWVEPEVDLIDIKGQDHAKRALMIAAAGAHNMLMIGPPGTGKTMLARALAGILPPLTEEEAFTATSLYSVAGLLTAGQGLLTRRPFRNPHYGASSVALIGGGANPKPGEVSLAHAGVLFLDELPEFPRGILDQLRQPIEDGFVTVARAAQTVRYPARAMLVAAMNPCKCGFIGSAKKVCRCNPAEVSRYQRRISGPLLDRFDLQVPVTDISVDEVLHGQASGMSSQAVAARVLQARLIGQRRQNKPNSHLTAPEVLRICRIDNLGEKLLHQAEGKFHLSARGVHRLLKTARTLADLEDSARISVQHLAEALQYREQLKQYLPEFI